MRAHSLFLFLALWCSLASQGLAQGAALREGGEVVLRSLGKYLGKGSTRETVESLAEYGGEAAVRRVADRALAEGGEQVLEQVASVAAKHGPEALRAMDNVGNLGPVLRSLDELPEESVEAALKRLAAGQPGRELAEVTEKYGARAIQAELRMPGVGTTLTKSLGEEGIAFSEKLTRDQAMTVARHASDIAALPATQRAGILELLHRDAQGMVAFMGRFMEKYPGRTLFAASATTIILAESDRVLGGDEIIFDEHGVPHLISKPGLAGRVTAQAAESVVKPLMVYLIPLTVVAIAAWFGIKLWGTYRKTNLSIERKRHS